jgi:hypothetical protein
VHAFDEDAFDVGGFDGPVQMMPGLSPKRRWRPGGAVDFGRSSTAT